MVERAAKPKKPSQVFCARCGNQRFVTEAVGDYAVARVCPDCLVTCELCEGKGYRTVDKNGYTYVVDCSCQNLSRRLTLFNRAYIPALYHDKLFLPLRSSESYRVHLKQEQAHGRVHQWAKGYTPGASGFVLMGSCGTGKTLFLCQVLAYLTLKLAVPGRYVEFSLLLEELRRRITERREDESIKSPLREMTVLAVDELGKVRGTDWELAELDSLITARYQTGRTTLFASNFTDNVTSSYRNQNSKKAAPLFGTDARSEEELASAESETLMNRIGTRIYSRLRECCEFIDVQGDDFRQREK